MLDEHRRFRRTAATATDCGDGSSEERIGVVGKYGGVQRHGDEHHEHSGDVEREWSRGRERSDGDDLGGGAVHGAGGFAVTGERASGGDERG